MRLFLPSMAFTWSTCLVRMTHPDNRPHSVILVGTGLFGGQFVSAHPDGAWHDPQTGTPVTFNADDPGDLDYQIPRTIDLEFRRTVTGVPANMLTHDGEVPGRNTYGILQPAPTIVTAIQYIGRESRRWGDGRGVLEAPDIKIYTVRTDPEAVVALMRKHYSWRGAAPLIARKTGLPERTVRAILGGRQSSPQSLDRLWRFAYQARLFDLE